MKSYNFFFGMCSSDRLRDSHRGHFLSFLADYYSRMKSKQNQSSTLLDPSDIKLDVSIC